jgi:hypothetical protein
MSAWIFTEDGHLLNLDTGAVIVRTTGSMGPEVSFVPPTDDTDTIIWSSNYCKTDEERELARQQAAFIIEGIGLRLNADTWQDAQARAIAYEANRANDGEARS